MSKHSVKETIKHLHFERSGFEFRELVTEAEIQLAYRLRYEICVEQLHWIEGDPQNRLESDQYDEFSYHFGCFDKGQLIGYVRMTPETAPVGIMSRNHFEELWHHDPAYPREQTADISRLIVCKPYLRSMLRTKTILMGLYRLAYGRARLCQPAIRYWYFITAPKLLRALHWQFGFAVTRLGHGRTSDGKITHAGAVDLEKARQRLRFLAPVRWHYFERAPRLERDHQPLNQPT